jgi:hypothetical protein
MLQLRTEDMTPEEWRAISFHLKKAGWVMALADHEVALFEPPWYPTRKTRFKRWYYNRIAFPLRRITGR